MKKILVVYYSLAAGVSPKSVRNKLPKNLGATLKELQDTVKLSRSSWLFLGWQNGDFTPNLASLNR
jgi:hypothetical protein